MQVKIELKNVKKSYGKNTILDSINFKVKEGEIVGIFGPSGCGKTTILEILAGLKRPEEGEIYLREKMVDGKNVFVPPEKRNIGFIFQDLALWPHMSVEEHLNFISSNKEINNRIIEMLNLDKLKKRRPEELSGGEKQRLAIARCLAQGTDILLMDEPLSSLDIKSKKKIIDIILKLREELNLTILYVSHDIFEITKLCDRILLLEKGKIKFSLRPSLFFRKMKNVIQL